jgi:hypothetical protein
MEAQDSNARLIQILPLRLCINALFNCTGPKPILCRRFASWSWSWNRIVNRRSAAQNQIETGGEPIGRTNSLPPAEEDAVELEPKEVLVGVPPARRRHRGVQRYRRVELRDEPPRALGLRRGGARGGAWRAGSGAERPEACGSGGGERSERSRGRHRRRRPANECDKSRLETGCVEFWTVVTLVGLVECALRDLFMKVWST